MLNQCAMGLDDADEEDLSSAVTDSAHHWQSTNVSDNNGKELGNRSSHLVLVTVEFADDGNESEKLDRCFTKGPDLLSDMSVLDTQQLNLLQPPNTVPFSILGYNPPFENESGTHLSDIENDKISISEAQMLLLKGNIDEENKETIVTLSKIHNSDSFLQNDVVITPLPETVVNTDLTNDIIKESSTVISSHTEFIAQGELTESPSVTRNSKRDFTDEPLDDILAGTGNENLHPLENSAEDMKDGTGWHLEESDVHLPETVCEEGWESDSSSDDQICQVIVDKPVMCRALASLPANFLCIEKTDSSVNGTDVGVFARKDIPKRTQFGPVEGMLSEEKFNIVSSDCTTLELLVEQDCGRMQRLDVSNEHLSNWMRYVRPAKTAKEQNLIVAQHGKLLYYTTTRSIQAREELKVWYSISYASIRGLPLLLSLAPQKSTGSGASGWPCNTCNLRLKHSADCMKCSKDHVKMVKIDKDIFPKYNLRNYQDSMQYEPIHKLGTTHRDRKWCCTHCQRCFNSATLLNLHTLTHAADNLESCTTLTNKSENKCSQCSQDDDKDKIEQENKPLNCRMCSKRFYTNSALVCHIKSHTGGKSLNVLFVMPFLTKY